MEVSREHPNMIKTLLNDQIGNNKENDNIIDSNINNNSNYRNCKFINTIDDFTGHPRFIKLKSIL